MSQRHSMRKRLTASLFLRSLLFLQQEEKSGVRRYGQRTVAGSLAAAVQVAMAVTAVTLALGGIYGDLIFSTELQKHASACKLPHMCFLSDRVNWSAPARRPTGDTVNVDFFGRTSALSSLPLLHPYSPTLESTPPYRGIIASVSGTGSSNCEGCSSGNNARNVMSMRSSAKTRKVGKDATQSSSCNKTSRSHRCKRTSSSETSRIVFASAGGSPMLFWMLPNVIGALAARPLHLRSSDTTEDKEEEDRTETNTDEDIDEGVHSRKRRRSSSSSSIARRRKWNLFSKATLRHPVTVASLAAAVFAAGLLAGAGFMALKDLEQREKAEAEAAEAFTKGMAANVEKRAIQRDDAGEGYAVYTRQMWSSLKIIAGTIITNALQTLLFTFRVSPVLFLIADSGIKAGVQAWAGGSTLMTVLQHVLLAGGYASAVGLIGSWQMLILPLGVYFLYLASGKGLTTKDSVMSGAIFAENMPMIESRLKAEPDPKKRVALADKLLESVARELKHKQLLDEGLRSALSQTLAQLKTDLISGMPAEESCLRAHKAFNKLLSLKFVAPPAPAAAGPGTRQQPENSAAPASTTAAVPPPQSPQGEPATADSLK